MPVEVDVHTVPNFKARINGKVDLWGPECGGTFTLDYSLVKIGHLLHKSRPVPFVFSTTVAFKIENLFSIKTVHYKWILKVKTGVFNHGQNFCQGQFQNCPGQKTFCLGRRTRHKRIFCTRPVKTLTRPLHKLNIVYSGSMYCFVTNF